MSVHVCVFCCVQQKIFFRRSFFLYSPCPYLEGIKDALCYKFRRLTIGQNCSAVCTNKGGHRDAFLSKRCKAPQGCSAGHRALSKTRGIKPVNNLVVDSTFEQSKKVVIAMVSLRCCCCCWPGVVYAIIGSKFMLLSSVCMHTVPIGWHTS